MKIEYDPEIDALYIELRSATPVRSIDIEEGVTIDLDEEGKIVGIELLDASERLKESLSHIELEEVPLRKRR